MKIFTRFAAPRLFFFFWFFFAVPVFSFFMMSPIFVRFYWPVTGALSVWQLQLQCFRAAASGLSVGGSCGVGVAVAWWHKWQFIHARHRQTAGMKDGKEWAARRWRWINVHGSRTKLSQLLQSPPAWQPSDPMPPQPMASHRIATHTVSKPPFFFSVLMMPHRSVIPFAPSPMPRNVPRN